MIEDELTFIVKSCSTPSPEMLVVIPRAHAANTTDRALAWLASEEETEMAVTARRAA